MYIDVNIGNLCFTATINMKRPNYTRSIAMQMSQCHKGWLFVDISCNSSPGISYKLTCTNVYCGCD